MKWPRLQLRQVDEKSLQDVLRDVENEKRRSNIYLFGVLKENMGTCVAQ